MGWNSHTSNPKEAEAAGVAWMNTTNGRFCGPPGASPDTLYEEQTESKAAMNQRIRDLTRDIRHTLNPEEYAEEIAKQSEQDSRRDEQASRRSRSYKAAKSQAFEKESGMNVEKLMRIYRDHGVRPADAKARAESLYKTAHSCMDEDADKTDGCKLITDNSNPKDIKKYYIPEILHMDDPHMGSPMQLKLLGWWRTYRRGAAGRIRAESARTLRSRLALYV